jgi:hypothetical protein
VALRCVRQNDVRCKARVSVRNESDGGAVCQRAVKRETYRTDRNCAWCQQGVCRREGLPGCVLQAAARSEHGPTMSEGGFGKRRQVLTVQLLDKTRRSGEKAHWYPILLSRSTHSIAPVKHTRVSEDGVSQQTELVDVPMQRPDVETTKARQNNSERGPPQLTRLILAAGAFWYNTLEVSPITQSRAPRTTPYCATANDS